MKANTVITKANSIINKSALKANPKPIKPQQNSKIVKDIQENPKEEGNDNNLKANLSFSVKNEKFKSIDLKDNENSKCNFYIFNY